MVKRAEEEEEEEKEETWPKTRLSFFEVNPNDAVIVC